MRVDWSFIGGGSKSRELPRKGNYSDLFPERYCNAKLDLE
jgi:hypothetical protein